MAVIQNISIIRGDDFAQTFQLTTSDTLNPSSYPTGLITGPTLIDGTTFTPIDLTGCVVLSQVRKTTSYAESLLTTFTVTVDNAANGTFTLSLTNAQTLAMASNDNAVNRYDVQVTDTGGKIKTYVIGEVDITMDVSRA